MANQSQQPQPEVPACTEEGQTPAEATPAAEGTSTAHGASVVPPEQGTSVVPPAQGTSVAPPQAQPGQQSAGSAAAKSAGTPKSTSKLGYYNTNVKRAKDFDFRMSGTKAKGMACGPSKQVVLHHLVLPSDHPAAAPMITEEVATVMVAKLLQKGVALKLDNRMEQSLRSIVAPGATSKRAPVGAAKSSLAKPEEIAKYDGLIATLEKDPALNSSPEKKQALEKLKNAKNTNSPLSLEEMTKIVEMCAALNMINKEQAKKLLDRMQEVGALTAEQNAEILREIEPKFVDGKIQVEPLRILIEEKRTKKK